MTEVDLTIIGGGIVGCTIAAAVAERQRAVVLLERAQRLAMGVTSRNSGVAHGGMYYPVGSLKARFCVRGRRLLQAFCQAHGVSYVECGKLIVAARESELPALARLLALGQANDVEGLRLLERHDVRRLEPAVSAVAALHSSCTAILDGERAARTYADVAVAHGAQVFTGAEVKALARDRDGWRVAVSRHGGEAWTHRSRWVVNAAGLFSDRLAALAGLDVDRAGLRLRWSKGNYFAIAAVHTGRVRRLVYPVPPADGSGLGIHLCLDLDGRLRLGPDVEDAASQQLDGREDYTVDPARRAAFFASGRTMLPFLAADDLTPDMAGLRPRLARAAAGFVDFAIRRETDELEGLINLIGIESPGLTAAPAIAEHVAGLLEA